MWYPSFISSVASWMAGESSAATNLRELFSVSLLLPEHLRKGRWAERRAARFLQARGLTILERNFRGSSGEIDLIARDRQVIVFVEVKFRTREDFALAEESLLSPQRRRILAAAREYLAMMPGRPAWRCDVIGITKPSRFAFPIITWLHSAFGPENRFS